MEVPNREPKYPFPCVCRILLTFSFQLALCRTKVGFRPVTLHRRWGYAMPPSQPLPVDSSCSFHFPVFHILLALSLSQLKAGSSIVESRSRCFAPSIPPAAFFCCAVLLAALEFVRHICHWCSPSLLRRCLIPVLRIVIHRGCWSLAGSNCAFGSFMLAALASNK